MASHNEQKPDPPEVARGDALPGERPVEVLNLDEVEGVGEISEVADLSELGVKETQPTIIDKTRAHIARTLTYATIGCTSVLTLVLTALIGRMAWTGNAQESDIQRIMPLITLVISQTLVPLTTIAITWYFASRSAEERDRKN
jgi:hypothetical protein